MICNEMNKKGVHIKSKNLVKIIEKLKIFTKVKIYCKM